jgi:hypothetical protein
LIQGEFKAGQSFVILAVNVAGIGISLFLLERQRRYLPFLV